MTYELITGYVTAPGTTLTDITMNSTDSLRIRHFDQGKKAWLVAAWTLNQGAGELVIKSPKMHDAVQNIKLIAPANYCWPLLPIDNPTPIYSDDLLTVQLSGSATAGDVECVALLIAYEDMPASQGRYATADEVRSRTKNLLTIKCDLGTLTATGYAGAQAIIADTDLLKAGTDYAILGCISNLEVGAVCIRGADTGNLRIGMPSDTTEYDLLCNWFVLLSDELGWPTIPIMNSENKNNTYVEVAKNETSQAVILYWLLAELG